MSSHSRKADVASFHTSSLVRSLDFSVPNPWFASSRMWTEESGTRNAASASSSSVPKVSRVPDQNSVLVAMSDSCSTLSCLGRPGGQRVREEGELVQRDTLRHHL